MTRLSPNESRLRRSCGVRVHLTAVGWTLSYRPLCLSLALTLLSLSLSLSLSPLAALSHAHTFTNCLFLSLPPSPSLGRVPAGGAESSGIAAADGSKREHYPEDVAAG